LQLTVENNLLRLVAAMHTPDGLARFQLGEPNILGLGVTWTEAASLDWLKSLRSPAGAIE
jgi:hypothetical protein